MRHHIHILGASGSGTTTLGKALAERMGCCHYDTDTYYWLPTEPPFQDKRQPEARVRLLSGVLSPDQSWVLSGSLCGWGDALIPRFSLVVFLRIPPELRMERLRQREWDRCGEAILPGGKMHDAYLRFLEWAAEYDTGRDVPDVKVRSLQRHERWLSQLPCPVVRLETDISVEERVDLILRHCGNV